MPRPIDAPSFTDRCSWDAALAAELTRPAPLAALALLVVNDHFLKPRFPGFITGKLSDFAGLFLFVVLAFVALDAIAFGCNRRTQRVRMILARVAAFATLLGFSLVKLVPSVNRWVGSWWGEMVLDPSDLVALPMTLLALAHLERGGATVKTHRAFRFLAFALSALACIATSPIRSERAYPMWKIQSLGARRIGCAVVDIWISKSGKEGVGASVSMRRAASGTCHVRFVDAELDAGGPVPAQALPAEQDIDEADRVFYIPFVFDNEASWNRGVREGSLAVTLEVSGAGSERLRLRMRHERPGPHSIPERPAMQLPPHSDAGLVIADPNAPLVVPADGGTDSAP